MATLLQVMVTLLQVMMVPIAENILAKSVASDQHLTAEQERAVQVPKE